MKTMNRIFSVIYVLIMCSAALFAQTTQNIRVLEYRGELGKQPLADVEISVGNAAVETSDADGRCTLQFRSFKPGDKVLVRRISCPGYVLFNREIVDKWYITDDDSELTVMMCKQEFLMNLREKYRDAVVEKLDIEYSGRLDSYEYADKLEELEEVIEKFIYIDVEEINDIEKKALELIGKGDVAGAIEAYDSQSLLEDYIHEQKQMAELEDAAKRVQQKKAESVAQREKAYEQVMRHVALLRYQGGKDNIDRSIKMLHDVVYADTTNFDVILEHAAYCSKIYEYDEAEAAVRLCANSADTITLIKAWIIQSVINSRRNMYGKSVENLVRSRDYLRKKSEERNGPTLYLAERVNVLLNLVSSYSSLRDSVGFFSNRPELLELARRYHELKNDSESKRRLVEVLYYAYQGNTYFGKNYVEQAEAYREAIELQEELYKESPAAQAAMLAFMHNALGSTYRKISKDKDVEAVLKEWNTAIKLYEEAFASNPKAYAGYLSAQYYNYADFYFSSKTKDMDKILSYIQKAESYANEDKRMSPDASISRIANVYLAYTKYYNLQKNYDLSEQYCAKAIAIIIELYQRSPKTYRSVLKSQYEEMFRILGKNPDRNAAKIEAYRKEYKEFGF